MTKNTDQKCDFSKVGLVPPLIGFSFESLSFDNNAIKCCTYISEKLNHLFLRIIFSILGHVNDF